MKNFGALVGIVSKSPHRLRASQQQSKAKERKSIAYFREPRPDSTRHEAKAQGTRHNWWVLYLMIMATIMMIGMALMALKMKIACSRFHCAFFVCVYVCAGLTLASCYSRFVCVCWVGEEGIGQLVCYFQLLHLLTENENGERSEGQLLLQQHYQHLILLRSFVCM